MNTIRIFYQMIKAIREHNILKSFRYLHLTDDGLFLKNGLHCVTVSRYNITHFYCLAVEAGFYSDVVECLPVDPASWVRFPAGAGKIFLLYDKCPMRGSSEILYQKPILKVV